MAIRFRKRIRIAPGVYINIGKKGISTSIGARGASVNIGKRGVNGTVGIPGSGLSYTTKLSGGKTQEEQKDHPLWFRLAVAGVVFFIVYILTK
ncbi:DUF4236 domain-containing protein [Serratia marcescens]|uniref:DUF4236 domain-containing protein n=1 Tax=Serratia marcescens TaxID=615 RepID=UPI0009516396|nr:DUF4236 domain-containing protein [Serratia marcescens]